MRHDRGGPLLYPGAAVSSRPARHNRSAPAASQRPALHPRCHNPSAREAVTRHQQRFTRLTRPIFPLPVAPGRNGNPSAFPPGFAPRRYQRRTPRWEQVSRTLTQSYTFDTVEPPNGKPTHYLRPRVALPPLLRGYGAHTADENAPATVAASQRPALHSGPSPVFRSSE